jgi:hypothetical protein
MDAQSEPSPRCRQTANLAAFAVASTGHETAATALELLTVGDRMQADRTEERLREEMAQWLVLALRFPRRFRFLLHSASLRARTGRLRLHAPFSWLPSCPHFQDH